MTNAWERGKIHDAFVLAVISPAPKDRADLCGLNMCIVIDKDPCGNNSNYGLKVQEAIDEHFKKQDGIFTVYLIGENGIKIPVDIHGGNGWSSQYYDCETCCYFGYIHPLMFGSTERGRAYAKNL